MGVQGIIDYIEFKFLIFSQVYGIEDSFISSMDPWKCVLTTVVENLPNCKNI